MTRSVLQLFLVIFAASIFSAHAEEFIAQKTLPASFPDLRDWRETVVRIEITRGSVVGSNGSPPTVEFKIVEVLRKGRFSPRKSQIVVASWLEDRAGGDQWSEHNMAGTLDQWSSIETESPPSGTRLIAFVTIESSTSKVFLAKDSIFADTPENRATVMANAASRPFLDWLSEMAFWLTFIFPSAGFMCLFYSPKLGAFLAMLSWPSYLLYDSQVPVTSNIRLDALLAYPALGIASLIAMVGFALWVRAEGCKG
jgi:hypothetical protein